MLYIGEKVGKAHAVSERRRAVRPGWTSRSIRSRGRTCAAPARPTRSPCSRRRTEGGLLHAPDLYMEKLVVGRDAKHAVFLDAPVAHNLRGIAKALAAARRGPGRSACSTVRVTTRSSPTSAATGARIKLIRDGDLSAGIAAAVAGSGVHAVMGIGGAPEGVLTAAAMRCLNGEIFARLVVQTAEHEARCREMGVTDLKTHLHGGRSRLVRVAHLRGDRRHRRRSAARACASSATDCARARS